MLLPPPLVIDEGVLKFCSTISSDNPIYVPVDPAPTAVPSYCFDNVANEVRKRGGKVAYGWTIWCWPEVYFEAEHHGVWKDRRRKLVDVTPGAPRVDRILFLPDATAVYDPNAFRSNRLTAIHGNMLAEEFVSLGNTYTSLVDRYRRPGATNPNFSFQDSILIAGLQARMMRLLEELKSKYPPPSTE